MYTSRVAHGGAKYVIYDILVTPLLQQTAAAICRMTASSIST